ncbi:MAG: CDP-alcohol phosphatidyltransferase family protein [Clostridia bacterium]|nr:CDP-alcohol phosphatidyltransferase family protein [Clostridia bacterium]
MTQKTISGSQKKILTVPNLLSLFRLLLIPVLVNLYVEKQNHLGTFLILILSALTDLADGIIARKCNMVSDLGKAFDPIADKLTQMAMLFCLIKRFRHMAIPFVLILVKETASGIAACIAIRRTGKVRGAVWHGKLTTLCLYAMMALHVIWYNIPQAVSRSLVAICTCLMLLSFILYIAGHIKTIKNKQLEG